MKVLAGDIGGTRTRLAVVDVELGAGAPQVVVERHFASRDAPGLTPLVRAFIAETHTTVDRAAFGIAGPVVAGECQTPNLPWSVSARALATDLGLASVVLVNDFTALGHGVPFLSASDIAVLQEGVAEAGGVLALIGAGTGLGEGFVVPEHGRFRVLPSEGGHANFAPRDDLEWSLQRFLAERYGHVSCERVLSGPGLVNIYACLAARRVAPENATVSAEIRDAPEPAAVVTAHALNRSDTLCEGALQLFTAAYGAQAGNLALTVMATGGVYIAGGIAPRILTALGEGGFLTAFRDKGRLSAVAARIPVRVIVNQRAALLGAAVIAAQA